VRVLLRMLLLILLLRVLLLRVLLLRVLLLRVLLLLLRVLLLLRRVIRDGTVCEAAPPAENGYDHGCFQINYYIHQPLCLYLKCVSVR